MGGCLALAVGQNTAQRATWWQISGGYEIDISGGYDLIKISGGYEIKISGGYEMKIFGGYDIDVKKISREDESTANIRMI